MSFRRWITNYNGLSSIILILGFNNVKLKYMAIIKTLIYLIFISVIIIGNINIIMISYFFVNKLIQYSSKLFDTLNFYYKSS